MLKQEQVKLVHENRVSVTELLSAHLQQIEKYNPSVNAICKLVAEQACEIADEMDKQITAGVDPGRPGRVVVDQAREA